MRHPKLIAFVCAAGLGLSACTSPDTYSEDPNQRTKEGAIAGALIGGVFGALTGDDAGERRRGALAGALVGGAVGAGIGYSLDQQAAELQRDFSDGRIQIINNGDHLLVRMPNDILFPVDSAVVNQGLQSDLRVLAASLQKYPGSTIEVVGHTDSDGSAAYNYELSNRRADAVASVLSGAGVSAARINAFGVGEDDPVDTNLTPEGKANNRRVDIKIIPKSDA